MIMLINLPSPFLIDQKVHPPLGLLYLGAVLQNSHIDVEVVDLANYTCGSLFAFNAKPELIGISATTSQFGYAKFILQKLKGLYPDVPVVIGGPHATVDPESCIEFDYVVIGEGEHAIVDYKNWGGKKIIQYPPVDDIDLIPFPDRDLIDIKSYKYYVDDKEATTLITSRGCPYSCAFCCHTWNSKVRMRSPINVIEEVRLLKGKYGYRAFMFFDDIFVMNRTRVTKIIELLKREDIIYRCFVRSDIVDMELLEMLSESGCFEVGFGAESGSQRILDIVGKNNSVEKNTKLVEMCREVGLKTKAFMIVGLPGETCDTAQDTLDWLKNVAPDSWDVSIYTPYKGSRITNEPSLYDIKINNGVFEDMWYKGVPGRYKCSISTNGLTSEDIVWWRDKIELELR